MKTGIYAITCTINGRMYIGQSIDIERRVTQHYSALNSATKTHHSELLQQDYNKYGSSKFKVKVLEECLPSQLDERERAYIDTYNPEYNTRVPNNTELYERLEHLENVVGELLGSLTSTAEEIAEIKERV